MEIYAATHNAHKLREIEALLPEFTVVPEDPDVEETASDFAGNALIKVRAVAAAHKGCWVMADDSGLEVVALGGEPGVRSARYAGEPSNTSANNALLLKNLEGETDRRANFTCCVALIDPNGDEHILFGRCHGRIAQVESGVGGFVYDPLFLPDGHARSFAELSDSEKNAISHRGRALAEVQRCIRNFSR